MPHKSQKRVHNDESLNSNINVSVMKAFMKPQNGSDVESVIDCDQPHSEISALNSSETSAMNSSIQSETSDTEFGGEEDVESNERLIQQSSLRDFVSFKIISNDKVLITINHDSSFYFKGRLQVKVIQGNVEVL